MLSIAVTTAKNGGRQITFDTLVNWYHIVRSAAPIARCCGRSWQTSLKNRSHDDQHCDDDDDDDGGDDLL